jgi:hypothetical protein
MNQIVFFLEEPSAKEMLKGFLPKLFPDFSNYRFIVFDGKQDLEKRMLNKMRGYLVPRAKFVVLCDQDKGDCRVLKQRLLRKCIEAGQPSALVRIACFELESWYLADLAAVERGLQTSGLLRYQQDRHYASPDSYNNPDERLEGIAKYHKVDGSRVIGPFLDPDNNRSHSFAIFVSGIRRLMENCRHENTHP